MYIMRLYNSDTGKAAAVSVFLFVITLILSLILFGIMSDKDARKQKKLERVFLVLIMNATRSSAQIYIPLIIPAAAAPTVLFFMKQYMESTLSIEMIEAARIDGSGELHTFNRVISRKIFSILY